uniref:AAA_12 domain-containing protein n=1 Tax=Caenorhabditis japonica TaxID=281687 RepID=A0A8R1HPS3_CAEJA
PPPEDSMQEVSDPLEPDFAAPIIIQGVQVPAKQKRHPFDGLYAPREGEEPPKDVTKRLVTSIVLSQIHSFRTKSLEWFIPIEKLNTPELAPAETDPVQVVSIPSTPFALYVLHTHYGSSASLSPVHRELTADDRPDLLYIQFSPRYARESTTGHAHDMGKFYAGDLLAVTRIGRLPDTTDEHFGRLPPARLRLPSPDPSPTEVLKWRETPPPGMFLQSKDPHTAGSTSILAQNIVPGSAKQHVVRLTNPLALRHKFRPTLINATTPSPDDNRLLQLANNPYGTLDVSNIDTMRSLLLAGRLAISAAIALSHRKADINFYTTKVNNVVPHFRGTIIKFKISGPSRPPAAESWSRDTAFDIERTNGETLHCKVLTMDSYPQHLAISARDITGANLQDLHGEDVFVNQSQDYALHDLRNFPSIKKAMVLKKKHHAFYYMPALFGGRPIEQTEINAPPITTERGVILTPEQSEFVARFRDNTIHAFVCDASFGTGKTYTVTYATTVVAMEEEGEQPLQVIFTPTNAAAHAAYSSFVEHDPLKKIPALRVISAKNRNRIDASLRTEYDAPEVLGKLFWEHVKAYDTRHPFGPVHDMIVLSALFFARSLYHDRCKPTDLTNRHLRRHFQVSREEFEPVQKGKVIRAIHKTRILFGTVTSLVDAFTRGDWTDLADLVQTIVIEEGSQVPRHVFIALANYFPKSRLVIVGDPKQLAPHSPHGMPPQLKSLGIDSVLAPAVDNSLLPRTNLRTVFRCPHSITVLLSKTFYDNTLEPKPKEAPSGLAAELGIGTEDGLYTIDLAYPETYTDPGYRNVAEADIAEALARRALDSHTFRSVGIVTVYKAQCSELASRLETTRVYTGTADASQGKEFDLSIVLTTRAATPTPFACEHDRTNVALSRAKKIMVVIVNHEAASQRKPWKQILANQPHGHRFSEQSIRRILNIAQPPPARRRQAAANQHTRDDREN